MSSTSSTDVFKVVVAPPTNISPDTFKSPEMSSVDVGVSLKIPTRCPFPAMVIPETVVDPDLTFSRIDLFSI